MTRENKPNQSDDSRQRRRPPRRASSTQRRQPSRRQGRSSQQGHGRVERPESAPQGSRWRGLIGIILFLGVFGLCTFAFFKLVMKPDAKQKTSTVAETEAKEKADAKDAEASDKPTEPEPSTAMPSTVSEPAAPAATGGSSSPKMASTPDAGTTPAVPWNADLARRDYVLDLPPRGPMTLSHFKELAAIPLRDPQELELALIVPQTGKTEEPRFRLNVATAQDPSSREWTVVRVANDTFGNKSETPIGTLRLGENSLQFAWRAAPEWTAPLTLQSSWLQFTVSDQVELCALSQPMPTDDVQLSLTGSSKGSVLPFNITIVDDPEQLNVDLTIVDAQGHASAENSIIGVPDDAAADGRDALIGTTLTGMKVGSRETLPMLIDYQSQRSRIDLELELRFDKENGLHLDADTFIYGPSIVYPTGWLAQLRRLASKKEKIATRDSLDRLLKTMRELNVSQNERRSTALLNSSALSDIEADQEVFQGPNWTKCCSDIDTYIASTRSYYAKKLQDDISVRKRRLASVSDVSRHAFEARIKSIQTELDDLNKLCDDLNEELATCRDMPRTVAEFLQLENVAKDAIDVLTQQLRVRYSVYTERDGRKFFLALSKSNGAVSGRSGSVRNAMEPAATEAREEF